MSPWWLIAPLVAGINLFAFVAVRGHWDRLLPVLALAAGIGVAAGDAIGGATGLELIRIGTFHLVAASVGAQLAMLAVVLLTALAPLRENDGERAR
jgi:hypothetical protein